MAKAFSKKKIPEEKKNRGGGRGIFLKIFPLKWNGSEKKKGKNAGFFFFFPGGGLGPEWPPWNRRKSPPPPPPEKEAQNPLEKGAPTQMGKGKAPLFQKKIRRKTCFSRGRGNPFLTKGLFLLCNIRTFISDKKKGLLFYLSAARIKI